MWWEGKGELGKGGFGGGMWKREEKEEFKI